MSLKLGDGTSSSDQDERARTGLNLDMKYHKTSKIVELKVFHDVGCHTTKVPGLSIGKQRKKALLLA